VSQVVFLNGCGSSGKTCIAKAIQQESPDLWLHFGVDTFIDMIPFGKEEQYLKFILGNNERGPTMHVESGAEGGKLFSVMPQFSEMLADLGNNLIIDEVLFDEEALKAHTVYYIGVFCDLAVMQEREILRRDRCIGLSNDQFDRVHQGALNAYDFKVNTTVLSPFEAARLILQYVDTTPAPNSFQLLYRCFL
jgi:chloramphenicol 3-O phosphotransferase